MLSAAERVAGDLDFLRVDLYYVDEEIYLGEWRLTQAMAPSDGGNTRSTSNSALDGPCRRRTNRSQQPPNLGELVPG